MGHIIFINQYVTHLFVDIINDFVAKGFEVTLVTGGIHSTNSLSDKVKIKKSIAYKRNNYLKRLVTWHLFGIQAFFYLLFCRSPIFLTTNPPFLPIICWIYHKFKRQRFHIIYYDLYPNALERMGYISAGNPIYKVWTRLNKQIILSASTAMTIGENLKASLQKNLSQEKIIHVIPPWADNKFIQPLDKKSNPFAIKHQIQEKLVVLYSGNLGITHDIESLFYTALELERERGIKFIVIGEGSKKKWFENFIKSNELSNVLLLGWQPEDQLPLTFASADIGVITLGKGAEGLSVPSKTYAYMAAGSALLAIADKESELGILIDKYKAGERFNPGDLGKIKKYILTLWGDRKLLNQYKKNSRSASSDFGPENAEKFYNLVNKP